MKISLKTYCWMLAMVLCACSRLEAGEEAVQPDMPVPFTFGAYMNRPVTRAGAYGNLTLDLLKKNIGFGVMATYTGQKPYRQAPLGPNFMYNEWIQWSYPNSVWTYEPMKYWPNSLVNPATGVILSDRVSVFAYAPYVAVDPDTGWVTDLEQADDGIIGLSRLQDDGDPLVYYTVPMQMRRQMDLCWGTSDGEQTIGETTVQDGMPLLDLTKMENPEDRINIRLHHALAQLSVTVDATVNGVPALNLDADHTRIYVRRVSFTGFALSGALNLNNTVAFTPRWSDYHGLPLPNTTVTFHDGRWDGSEGSVNGANTSEVNRVLNPRLVQVDTYTMSGVTKYAQSLFDYHDEYNPQGSLYVIPTGGKMDVTIEYDIETRDPKLTGHYLSDGTTEGHISHNRITKYDVFQRLEAGNSYVLHLHLGLTEVKADVEVNDWMVER